MNTEDVNRFEKIVGQLNGIYEEISLLSKKNPNDAVNKFKLKFINNQLSECNSFLTDEYHPFRDFEQFSEDDIPQNSDVVFIISQYLNCLEKLRADHVVLKNGAWQWRVSGVDGDHVDENGFTYIRSSKPKRLRE